MRKLYSLSMAFMLVASVNAQTTIFSDDFESGLGAWTLTGDWGLATTQAYNGTFSLADSPGGLYNNMQTTFATITNSFNLSTALDANIFMRVKYDIENGFDYCYIDMSSNNGGAWTTVYTFNGENNLANWADLVVNAGGFVGNSQVKFRFRFFTDQAYQSDGIFIDSFRIVSDTVDNAPPLIVHDPDPHFEGQSDTNFRDVTITDISGVASALLTYSVDNGPAQTLTPYDTNGNVYTFAIPPQTAGAYVDYYISAEDSATNAAVSLMYQYIAGNYINHDNAIVSTVVNFSSTGFLTGVANRITLDGLSTLTTALLRNYTDINNPNDSIEFHVWTNNNGVPGTDIITPFNVFPEASLLEPQRMTRIDLRNLETQLDSLDGDIFIGFEVPSGSAWACQTTGANGRGYNLNNTNNWTAATTTYHFRAITTAPAFEPDADFSYDNANDPTLAFTDLSSNNPTSWAWNFGDGTTSTLQNPTHTFPQSGIYNVCLTATNGVGSSTPYCEQVIISNGPPIASFTPDLSNDPTASFTETSQNNPTSWSWDFGDGGSSTQQNPSHTYALADDYNVCLVATNQYGSDTTCQIISIDNQLPIPLFDYEVLGNNIVSFDNLTAVGSPPQTNYTWYFDVNNDSSNAINPTYAFPRSGGTFNVCLKASNAIGTAPLYCDDLELENLVVGLVETSMGSLKLMPNPATDQVFLNMSQPDAFESLSVFSLDGKLQQIETSIFQGNVLFSVDHLPKGIYFTEVILKDGYAARIPLVVQ